MLAAASVIVVRVLDGVAAGTLVARCARPLAACVPMAAAVLGVRHALADLHPQGALLLLELVVGALAYIASALVLARPMSRELLALARRVARTGSPAAADYQRPSSTASTVSSSDIRGAKPSTCRARTTRSPPAMPAITTTATPPTSP